MDYDERGLTYDRKLEQTALGCIMLNYVNLKTLLSDTKITSNSFYIEQNQNVFKAILKLFEENKPANETLVSSELNGSVPKNYIYDLVEEVPDPNQLTHYVYRLVELEKWRQRRLAALAALKATEERDIEKFALAKQRFENDEIKVNSMRTASDLGLEFEMSMDKKDEGAFKLPYEKFNTAMGGGLRRKQMTLIGGWSSHGKSVVMDQWLETFSKAGHSCHLYINEMGVEDRVGRSISRHSSIAYNKLLRHELNSAEKQKVESVVADGAPYFNITECAGWSVQELAYDIRSRNFDVVGIDILHQFDYDSESELARISRELNRITKQSNCHIIATVHLNEFRVSGELRPRPVLRDIRGSGMLKNDADNVIMIFREQDQHTFNPTQNGMIYSLKARNGELTNTPLLFLDKSFSFEEADY